MPNQGLQPGDTVVALAGVVQSVAALTGGVVGAVTTRLAKRSWMACGIAFIVGGVAGFALGFLLGRIFYRTAEGMVTVVRAGPASLPVTIRAGLVGSLPSAILVASAAVIIISAPAQSSLVTSLLIGLVLGVAFACCGSLL